MIIRFAGDSGDGMQLAGDRFTQETAAFGNDLSTLPNFPAEIRAPAGTLPGVSSFQLHFADHDILTPGDAPDVLVAMNPAALMANIEDLPRGADIIANTDEFTKRNLTKVGYEDNPLEDGSLDGYQLHAIPITSVTVKALEGHDISKKDAERAKNMFSLGMLCWLYNRPAQGTLRFLESKFAKKPEIMKANIAAFQAGWNYETTEEFSVQYEIKPSRHCRPAITAISLATRRWRTASSRPRGWLASSCSSARTRSPRRPTFCTSCPSTSGSGSAHSRQRMRSAASVPRSGRPSAARSA